jgi:hypothetical protein
VAAFHARPASFASTSLEHCLQFSAGCFALPIQDTLLLYDWSFLVAPSCWTMQLLTAERHGRIQDAIEKMAGGSAGLVTARMILLSNIARQWFQK